MTQTGDRPLFSVIIPTRNRAKYHEVLDAAPAIVRLLNLVRVERGHGQSYALNFGAATARGVSLFPG